ncbi:hypothetical protein GCM10022217_24230 [Chryseobacterium ginsenosidimutans]|uniref:hypothetical protein n=1 Tax=Chryseobacterium ginsenosidimutans TaxID=687846 RepID=UPI0031D6DFCD
MRYKILKKLTTGLALILGVISYSQVGIDTNTPHTSADLDLAASNKALYLNRVANVSVIANPQPGMMIYDISEYCVKTYGGNPTGWSGCLVGSTDGNGTVASLTCGSVVFNPTTATQGQAYTGTLTVPYTGGNGGNYAAQGFTQNGLTFTLPAGSFNTGAGNIVYNINGTPVASGMTSINVTIGGESCTGLTFQVQ